MSKGLFHLLVVTGFAVVLIGYCGCGGKTNAPTKLSPEQVEKARQQHIEMSKRELSEK